MGDKRVSFYHLLTICTIAPMSWFCVISQGDFRGKGGGGGKVEGKGGRGSRDRLWDINRDTTPLILIFAVISEARFEIADKVCPTLRSL